MAELPPYARNFVAASSFEVICHTELGERPLLLEMRRTVDGGMLLFTVIDGQQLRINSIHEFVLTQHDCSSVTIRHAMSVLWDGVAKKADLFEVFAPTQDPSYRVSIGLELTIDGATYRSGACVTLPEAMIELGDAIGPGTYWSFQTCCDCDFSGTAFLFPVDERDDLRCYRDAPEAFAEVRREGKSASLDALYAGNYYVNAFHTCAAWQPRSRLKLHGLSG